MLGFQVRELVDGIIRSERVLNRMQDKSLNSFIYHYVYDLCQLRQYDHEIWNNANFKGRSPIQSLNDYIYEK